MNHCFLCCPKTHGDEEDFDNNNVFFKSSIFLISSFGGYERGICEIRWSIMMVRAVNLLDIRLSGANWFAAKAHDPDVHRMQCIPGVLDMVCEYIFFDCENLFDLQSDALCTMKNMYHNYLQMRSSSERVKTRCYIIMPSMYTLLVSANGSQSMQKENTNNTTHTKRIGNASASFIRSSVYCLI